MGTLLNNGGDKNSVTPSTRLLNLRLGISPAPRALTASEISLLRQSKREIYRSTVTGHFMLSKHLLKIASD